MSAAARPVSEAKFVTIKCDCGQIYRALQPRRGGDFKLFAWFPFPWQWPGFEHLKPTPKIEGN